jgi:hypothetical protein
MTKWEWRIIISLCRVVLAWSEGNQTSQVDRDTLRNAIKRHNEWSRQTNMEEDNDRITNNNN